MYYKIREKIFIALLDISCKDEILLGYSREGGLLPIKSIDSSLRRVYDFLHHKIQTLYIKFDPYSINNGYLKISTDIGRFIIKSHMYKD